MIITSFPLSVQTIHRQRILPNNGKVLVRVGQTVQPWDTVAETIISHDYIILDAVKTLNCSIDDFDKALSVSVGDSVTPGDILVSKKVLLLEKHLLSPCYGKIKWIEYGKIWIEKNCETYKLYAGYSGKISAIHLSRGVTIESIGMLCFGVWGNQKVGFGRLNKLAQQPMDILNSNDISEENKSEILTALTCDSASVFQKAEQVGLAGLVFSWLSPEMLPAAKNASTPIIVMDGFGSFPPNQRLNQFFHQNIGEIITLNANQNHKSAEWPELFCPKKLAPDPESAFISNKEDLYKKYCQYNIGQKVKITFSGFHGSLGTIINILPNTFPNGLSFQSAEVQISPTESVIVPLSNLEIIVE